MENAPKKTSYAKHIIKCYKDDLKYRISKNLMNYLPNLEGRMQWYADTLLKYSSFPLLYSALFYDPDIEDIRYIRDTANNIFGFNHDNAFFVNALMKKAPFESGSPDFDEWDKLNTVPKDYYGGDRVLLILGSAHPNGHVREQCLRRFLKHSSMLNHIIYRLNDNVPAVRKAAGEVLAEYLKRPDAYRELIRAIPYVEYVRRGERAHRDAAFSMEELDSLLRKAISENKLRVRDGICYNAFKLHPDASRCDTLLKLFRKERNGEQRVLLERMYLQTAPQPISREVLNIFMEDNYEGVRRTVYAYRIQHEGIWEGFEELLCSKSRRIRKFAEQQLDKNGFDVADYCRKHLPDTILALSDKGTKEDIPLIRPYLDTHPCEALTALVRLIAEDSSKLIYDNMHSDDPAVAKTAYRLARGLKCFDVKQLISMIHNDDSDTVLQQREILLLTKDGAWHVMPHLIRLAGKYPRLNRNILYLIKKNLQTKVKLPADLKNEIQQALREGSHKGIPYEVNNRIFYVMN
ncbi:MAG: hypothetical protein K6F71_08655 [Ruminococcus sp.]|uniref:hypothetical protein n=1 Tax=Ruminococcus sp. TaxID=41978 RepID=UPI0025CE62A3|nr:hypothetical protein [Ruminococcus sp.]MCR5540867.1 hypothetical protein [Ruminococcus sp.]